MKKFVVILICSFCLVGCSDKNDNNENLISYVEAKEQIINYGAILMDVRTEEEYNEKHIDGAILVPLDTIDEDSVAVEVPNKETAIIVYCQSGNRSHQAVEKLKSLGYSNVYDLGAISNWKE